MTKVKLLKPYGWCKGVENAFKHFKQIKRLHPNYKIYMMGDLVHNTNSLRLIKSKNIFFIKTANQISFLECIKNKNVVIVFPAHGYSLDAWTYAKQNFKYVYELTCPFIKSNIKLMTSLIHKKNKVFYFGLKNHSETKYIMSMNKSIKLVESLDKIKNIKFKIYLVSQSTIPTNTIDKHIYKNKNIFYIKTTCNASNLRHNNILKLSKNIDLLLVVGDKTSNNTMSLVKLAKQMKIKTKLVQSQKDIIKSDFNNIKTCYIASGTSTTKKDVEQIYRKIISFNS